MMKRRANLLGKITTIADHLGQLVRGVFGQCQILFEGLDHPAAYLTKVSPPDVLPEQGRTVDVDSYHDMILRFMRTTTYLWTQSRFPMPLPPIAPGPSLHRKAHGLLPSNDKALRPVEKGTDSSSPIPSRRQHGIHIYAARVITEVKETKNFQVPLKSPRCQCM